MTVRSDRLAAGTLTSHLLELRNRLIRGLLAVGVLFLPSAFYANRLFTLIAQPLIERLPAGTRLIATSVTAPFTAPFKLAFFVALFLAMPYVVYQLWAFVTPALHRRERRFALPLLLAAVVLFYAGMVFAYFFVFPAMFRFFAGTTPHGVTMMTDISQYLDFVLLMFLGFGAAFELPVAVVLLVLAGIVDLERLKSCRGYVLVGVFIVAACLTPPDAVSQSLLAIPMYLLFEGGLVMARILERGSVKGAGGEQSQAS
jgi:sec-independent protein translocase protein TatC